MKEYDVVVLGAGTAGLTALKEIKKVTENFLLINDGPLGTTCARVGCMPSKSLIQIAHDFHRRRVFSQMGIGGADQLTIDSRRVLSRVRQLRDHFTDPIVKSTEHYGERFIRGKARFVEGAQILEVNGERIKTKRTIVATGTSPIIPETLTPLKDRLITSDEIFELEVLPDTLAVIGLGVVGLELGQAVARLGTETKGFSHSNFVGGLTDPEINTTAVDIFKKEFPLQLAEEVTVEDLTSFDKILVAVGRKLNLAGLGLEALGINFESGLKTDLPIFFAGDVTGTEPVLHHAVYEGKRAAWRAMEIADRSTPPVTLAITFCDPNIASVGQSFNQLPTGTLFGEVDYADQGRAKIRMENRGKLRIYAEPTTLKLIGAEMCCPGAEHLAHFLALALQNNLTVPQLLKTPFYHPVLEEGLKSALLSIKSV
jgi:dihydrolipoamide dehydrogenase